MARPKGTDLDRRIAEALYHRAEETLIEAARAASFCAAGEDERARLAGAHVETARRLEEMYRSWGMR